MKKFSRSMFAIAVSCALLLGVSLSAQTRPAPASTVPSSPADIAWANLQGVAFAPSAPESGGPSDATAVKLATDQQILKSRNLADQAKDFYTKNPAHAKAVEAKKIEALQLLQAVQLGDTSIEGRMETTVNSFCSDTSVLAPHRAEVAGVHGFNGALRKHLQGAELYVDYENTARSLIVSYPSQPQGYESLLTIAVGSDDTKGRALARELLRSPAPASVKAGAQFLIDRLDLVGQRLGTVLGDAGATRTRAALQPGKPTVIYTWATWSPGSIALGEILAQRNLSQANLIGLNLDEDGTAAAAQALAQRLPGVLHYDGRGMQGALAQRLRVHAAPMVFLVDAQGVIRDVRGMDNLEHKLTQSGL